MIENNKLKRNLQNPQPDPCCSRNSPCSGTNPVYHSGREGGNDDAEQHFWYELDLEGLSKDEGLKVSERGEGKHE